MYQLNLNQEEKDLLEDFVCSTYNSMASSALNAKRMLDAPFPMRKTESESYRQEVKTYEILSNIHLRLHSLSEEGLSVVDLMNKAREEGTLKSKTHSVPPPHDPDAIPTIIDSITGKTYVKLDLDILLRVYAKLAIYKEQVVSENQSNFKANRLKPIVEGHNYIGNLIRTLSK